jgi:hypothetical protein
MKMDRVEFELKLKEFDDYTLEPGISFRKDRREVLENCIDSKSRCIRV